LIDNPPERIKGLPRHAQEIWIATYNNAVKQYGGDEEKLNAIAWAAVKQKYEKDERGKWVLIDNSEEIISVNTELDGQVPAEIQVIPFGRHSTPKGDFELDEDSADRVVHEFNSRANDMVIDTRHSPARRPLRRAG
jgi:cation transport regulator